MLYIGKAYFEGFEEKFILNKKGTGFRKVRVYEGDVYSSQLSPKKLERKKAAFALLGLLYFGLLIFGGCLRTVSTGSRLVMLPYAAGLLTGGYCLIGIFHFTITGREMTVFQFNEFRKQLRYGALGAVVAMIVCMLGQIAVFLVNYAAIIQSRVIVRREAELFLCTLAGAGSMLVIWQSERKAKYTMTPATGPKDDAAFPSSDEE